MNTAYFVEKELPPNEPKLKKTLRELYEVYKDTLELSEGSNNEWKYYGKRIGWQLKAMRKGKALFYLAPLEQSFRIAFAVKEHERDMLLHSKLSPGVKRELESAKKYPEGYPLRLEITKKTDMKHVRAVLAVLKEAWS